MEEKSGIWIEWMIVNKSNSKNIEYCNINDFWENYINHKQGKKKGGKIMALIYHTNPICELVFGAM